MASKQVDVESLNIYQRLALIRKQVEVVQKDKSGYGYKYVSDDELLARITSFMDKYHISLIPSIDKGTLKAEPYTYYKTKKAENKQTGEVTVYKEDVNEVLVQGDMTYYWINNDNPTEQVGVPWGLVGQQSDGSQAMGSGLTYSMRYFLLKYFNVATPEDDPDRWRSKQKAAADAEDKAIAESIIKIADVEIRNYLAKHEEATEAVGKFARKYVKSGNYLSITDSAMAQNFLDAFRENFKEE